MPTVLRWNGYRFFFFSNEGRPLEERHIHVRNGDKLAKFWLDPEVQLAGSFGMTSSEIRQLADVVENHVTEMRRAWDEHFKF